MNGNVAVHIVLSLLQAGPVIAGEPPPRARRIRSGQTRRPRRNARQSWAGRGSAPDWTAVPIG